MPEIWGQTGRSLVSCPKMAHPVSGKFGNVPSVPGFPGVSCDGRGRRRLHQSPQHRGHGRVRGGLCRQPAQRQRGEGQHRHHGGNRAHDRLSPEDGHPGSAEAVSPAQPSHRFCHAWIKSKLGLRQFHLRGLAKLQMEMLWACLTYNLQQWIRLRKLSPALLPLKPTAAKPKSQREFPQQI